MIDAPRIRFATTEDGVRIAYTASGEGPPLLMTPGWVSHQESEWQGPSGEFNRRLAQQRQLVLFDGRGTGLSDRSIDDISIGARIKDIEAIVEHLDLQHFALYGVSQWTPAALVYAAEHPEQVERLILYSPFSEGFLKKGTEEGRDALGRALLDLIRAEWGVGARTTLGFIHPDADKEEERETLRFLRQASSGETAARILEEGMFDTDVREYVARIEAPALVLHRRQDNSVPLEAGRQVASSLPNARFIPLEGDHHLQFYGDTESVLRAVEEFLGVETAPVPAAGPVPATPAVPATAAGAPGPDFVAAGPPVTILFTDIEGSTALTSRLGDAPAQELLQDHNAIVRQALAARGGTEIKHTGDGIMASFEAASSALQAAIDIQRALARRNEERPEAPVNVRIGLNVGEPVREQNDLFGTAVQLARRICDRAEPGEILASNVLRELVAGKGFLFAERGETVLRGFEDQVRLFQVRWSE